MIRVGRYQDVLADVTQVDALICDPPYGARTHSANTKQTLAGNDDADRRPLHYGAWGVNEIDEFVQLWEPRVRGWMAIMSCSDLAPAWRAALEKAGRYAFAPVPCVIRGMTVRMAGDGPSSWSVMLNVARPKSKEWMDGTRPGAYVVGRGERGHIGGKPLELMKLIMNDYTRPGDLVVDPCAGFATTGVAALACGRRFVGAEVDPVTARIGAARINTTLGDVDQPKEITT